jgi:hypothetical protein
VREGATTSSLRYKRRSDGKANRRRAKIGITVQIVSTAGASEIRRFVYLLNVKNR